VLHVLSVEDNPADVLMIREGIRTSPVMADLMIAYDGEQAFRCIREFGYMPDLVFLDLTVPKLDSFDFLERLCANQGRRVIVLTGSHDPAKRQRAIRSGAEEYIVKPTDMDEFLKIIRDAIARWGDRSAARRV
jgi:DNA-binding response OmpR family regulator